MLDSNSTTGIGDEGLLGVLGQLELLPQQPLLKYRQQLQRQWLLQSLTPLPQSSAIAAPLVTDVATAAAEAPSATEQEPMGPWQVKVASATAAAAAAAVQAAAPVSEVAGVVANTAAVKRHSLCCHGFHCRLVEQDANTGNRQTKLTFFEFLGQPMDTQHARHGKPDQAVPLLGGDIGVQPPDTRLGKRLR